VFPLHFEKGSTTHALDAEKALEVDQKVSHFTLQCLRASVGFEITSNKLPLAMKRIP